MLGQTVLQVCNLVLLAGADGVMWCTGMTSMLESIALELVDCSGQTLLSASAMTFSFPLRNSMFRL